MYLTAGRFKQVSDWHIWDLNFEERYVVFRREKNGTLNERYPMCDALERVLREWLKVGCKVIKKNGGLLFPSRTGGKISAVSWCATFAAARKRAGLHGRGVYAYTSDGKPLYRLSGHSAKAMRLQYAEAQELHPREIQAIAHHLSPQSTARYLGNPMENYGLKMRAFKKL